ncbi:hypothetical protein [Streptomyces beigongshangae]|uniref:hypothetical protein n=1 Tax=Streptomyces beigongshangae TaxID=2841597 RepID=UPI001C861C50|nr:hypothetical protein [Streptomyces sp. REN17]
MADETGDADEPGGPGSGTPGEAAAAQERSFWENRRRYHELDDDEAGRRERRRLSRKSRRLNLDVRVHRYARSRGDGPVPGDLRLPPLPPSPDRETFPDEDDHGALP